MLWRPVPSIQSASELNQNIFRTILTFSTDSERFQNNFCIDSETSLNQSKIQNLCPLNFSESEENSECNSELVLNQTESQKLLTTLQESTKNFLTGYLTVIQRLFEFFFGNILKFRRLWVLWSDFNAAVLMLWVVSLQKTSCMGYVNCECAKNLVRICLFGKELSLFKEVAIFSIIIIVFKIGFIGLSNNAVFRHFRFRTRCMSYVNCESAKKMDRIRLFEEKLSLFKEVAIFSIIGFNLGVIGTVKYCSFPAFKV